MTLPNFPQVDLFAAGVNALNGVLQARSPSHDRNYTFMGLLIMAYFGGIGGGVTRDILLSDIPGPIKDWRFPVVCTLMGLLGLAIYHYSETKAISFRRKMLCYFKSFTLPWFAILGSHKALDHGIGIIGSIAIGLIATTAGGVLIDLFSGLTPEVVRPAEQLVVSAIIASTVYTLIAVHYQGTESKFPITLIAAAVAFAYRVIAVREHWHDIVPGGERPAAPGAGTASV
jgi:uncharacterized membrane protein YeiH